MNTKPPENAISHSSDRAQRFRGDPRTRYYRAIGRGERGHQ